MKQLTANEVQAVSGAGIYDGCHFTNPVELVGGVGAPGGGYGVGFGIGMKAGGALGAMTGAAGWTGYTIGVGFNHLFGRCD